MTAPRIEIEDAAREHAEFALERLQQIAAGADPKAAVAACRELLDRGYGKPKQSVTVSREANPEQMTRQEIDDAVATILAAERAAAERSRAAARGASTPGTSD